jgi:hypothetical protein
MSAQLVRILKEAFVAYFKALFRLRFGCTGETLENLPVRMAGNPVEELQLRKPTQ